MRTPRSRAAALAAPLCLLVALTAAQVVDRDDVRIDFDGTTFAIEAAGSTSPGWQPGDVDWHSSTDAWTVDLAHDVLVPGVPLELRVAVRNVSGTPAAVDVAFDDTAPASDGFFDSLHVVVRDEGRVLAAGPAHAVRATLPGDVGPHGADVRVLDVEITSPATGDDRWAGARTGLQVLLEGTSR